MGAVETPVSREPQARERIAFVTGKLAEPALRSILESFANAKGIEAEVVVLNIAVAALMTTEWAAKRISLPDGVSRAVIPGYCSGDLERLRETTGVPFERGPKDLRELPMRFGAHSRDAERYGAHSIEILAEINHVPRLSVEEVLAVARRYRKDGADVIDLGCDPDGPFTGIAGLVRELRGEGFRVSIDSMDPREIVPAVEAGAEIVLSCNSSNIDALRGLPCELVVVPDTPSHSGEISTMESLDRSIEKLASWGMRYRIDPVIEPIGFGFAKSLGRYLEVRQRHPHAEMLMGIGNLTELTDADTAPMNVMLLGFCEEIGIHSVLTTEVISWAASCVREVDIARKLVHFAVRERRVPKHIEPELHLLRDPRVLRHGPEFLEALARDVRDRNFRIFAEDGQIHVIARGLRISGKDPFEIFEQLKVDDSSHAFYLGYEMAKAVTALTLGKSYTQDEALRWGFLTAPETSHIARPRQRDAKGGEGEPSPEAAP